MDKRTCPNCGHENLPRAIFCFQCGANLENPPVMRGIHRQRRHVEDAMRHAQDHEDSLEPEMVQKLREAKKRLPANAEESAITCLRCGTFNQAQANYCIGCGATLCIPDEMTQGHLVPHAGGRSDVGLVRDNNEDRIGLWGRHGIVLALIADGMGGAAAGEEASRLVVEAVQADFLGEARGSETLQDLSEEEIADKLRAAVRRANHAIILRARENPDFRGMGTTMTLAFVRDHRVVIAHVGDSRAYLVDGSEGWINQVTDDHSFVEALVASGHITADQAASHPMRNVLYRALGQVDGIEPDLYSRNLADSDRLILCSDGLTRHVAADEIARLSRESDSPEAITQTLIDLARERGGEDNISAIVIVMERAEDVDPGQPPATTLLDEAHFLSSNAEESADRRGSKRDTQELEAIEPSDDDTLKFD